MPASCLTGLLPRLSELMTTLWRSKVLSSTVSSMSYQRGMLPLGEADAALNPKLDKHFSFMTELLQSRENYAGDACSLMNRLIQVFEYRGWAL